MNELQLFAKHYFELGLNTTCISNRLNQHNFYGKNILKNPNHKWEQYFKERQSLTEFESYDWENATGVGSVTGFNEIRVIDIDGCNDFDFLEKALKLLNLPQNYEWVVQSGSKNGFHIIIRCCRFRHLDNKTVVTTYPPKNQYKHILEKVEILWDTHIVLPPSLHNSGNTYSFLNCKVHKSLPKNVREQYVTQFIGNFLDARKIETGEAYGRVLYEFMASNIPSNVLDNDLDKFLNKPIYCVLDIETDGFPENKNGSIVFPNVVQVAWILMNTDGVVLKKESELINFPNIKYTNAFEIHNLNIEVIKQIGKHPNEVYSKLINDLKTAQYVVAHNIEFDIPILRNQFKKYQLQDVLANKQSICTMQNSTEFCNIKDNYGRNRYPKLTELYNKLFNYEVLQYHNAESDILLTAKCFKELIDKKIIDLDTN